MAAAYEAVEYQADRRRRSDGRTSCRTGGTNLSPKVDMTTRVSRGATARSNAAVALQNGESHYD